MIRRWLQSIFIGVAIFILRHSPSEVSQGGTLDLWDEIAAGPADDDDLSPRRAP